MHNNEIIKEIVKRQQEIFSNISLESVSVYIFLKNEYKKGNIIKNTLFQFVFRSYYRLDNAGLGDDLKKKYFELMASKQTDLKKILLELYKVLTAKKVNTVQFSFATKLLHTLDNELPIFDAEVSRVFHKSVSGKNKEQKIESCLKINQFLIDSYSEILKDDQIKNVIKKFRSKFNIEGMNKISDTKILDFIVWSLGKLKK